MRYTIIFSLLLAAGCSTKGKNEKQNKPVKLEIKITDEQKKTIQIKTGPVTTQRFSTEVHANGTIDVPPQNLVTISAPMGGFVKSINLLQGMKITKGQVLVVMENPDYIQLQQDFLDSKSQFLYLENEFKRQEELSKENVNSEKTLQMAKSNYYSMKAKYEGLYAKLQFIHIDPHSLEGGIQPTITIKSPIAGYVTQVLANTGKYINTADEMIRLVDTRHLHAELQVFEKDIPQIQIGQKITVHRTNEKKGLEASVYLIGKEIDANRSVRIHGHFEEDESTLIPGMFITAEIKTDSRNASVLPQNSFVTFEGEYYVYVPTKANTYKMVEVKKGECISGKCEVTFSEGVLPPNVVTEGAYSLISLMTNIGK